MLTPIYTDADNGYRYYDNDNITRILQIQKFQSMGFDPEEIRSYYAGDGKADELLASLEKKLSILQQQVEEMRLRSRFTRTGSGRRGFYSPPAQLFPARLWQLQPH